MHQLETAEDEAYKLKAYPTPCALRDKLRKALRQMEEDGIEVRRTNPYNNPLTIIKNDRQIRICLDARKLNTVLDGKSSTKIRRKICLSTVDRKS